MPLQTAKADLSTVTHGDVPVKVVVWDLDDTLWEGTLVENEARALKPGIPEMLRKLDERGVLQSIASRNDRDASNVRLAELGIGHFFVVPQIGWSSKSQSLVAISRQLGLAMNSILFVDDQDFELAEVSHGCPEVRVLPAGDLNAIERLVAIDALPVTPEAAKRRSLYQDDARRNEAEEAFAGPAEEFMASLDLQLRIRRAQPTDLDRVQELVSRTNQLNTNGTIYSKKELARYARHKEHILLVAELGDIFGDYGTIGVALLKSTSEAITTKLLLVSCRVLSRGIGTMLLNHVAQRAHACGKDLRVEFRDTGLNRPMKIALMMCAFRRLVEDAGLAVYSKDRKASTSLPPYVDVEAEW